MAVNGNIIKQLRKEAGLTQDELGRKLGVIKQTISSWENNISVPSTETLTTLSKLFGVSVDYLLGLSSDNPNDTPSRDKGFFFFFFFDDKDLQEIFVSALKTALETQNMTVSELCEKTEIDVDTCNQYLTGEHAPTL